MILRAILLSLWTSLVMVGAAAALPRVIDDAEALDSRSVAQLDEQLNAIEDQTGVRARLVFTRDLDDRIASEAAREFLDPESGDQIVLLFAMKDQQVRIERSEALSERIPEGVWTAMLASDVIPELRAVRQGAAARAGVSGIEAVLEGRYVVRPLIARGEMTALRDVGVIALVAALLALGLVPRSRARIVSRGGW